MCSALPDFELSPPQYSILTAEDEALIALDIQQTLAEANFLVLEPVSTVREALIQLDNSKPHAAILDAHLRDGMATSVAIRLRDLSIPFIIISGDVNSLPKLMVEGAIILGKPVAAKQLVSEVLKILGLNAVQFPD